MTQKRVLEGQAVSKWDLAKLKQMLINNAQKGYNSDMQGSSRLQKKMANTVAITAGSKHDHLWNADCMRAHKIYRMGTCQITYHMALVHGQHVSLYV